jgi:hypothetical protein
MPKAPHQNLNRTEHRPCISGTTYSTGQSIDLAGLSACAARSSLVTSRFALWWRDVKRAKTAFVPSWVSLLDDLFPWVPPMIPRTKVLTHKWRVRFFTPTSFLHPERAVTFAQQKISSLSFRDPPRRDWKIGPCCPLGAQENEGVAGNTCNNPKHVSSSSASSRVRP